MGAVALPQIQHEETKMIDEITIDDYLKMIQVGAEKLSRLARNDVSPHYNKLCEQLGNKITLLEKQVVELTKEIHILEARIINEKARSTNN